MMPTFDNLPFSNRPDLTPYLLHLTKNTKPDDDFSALDNLISILQKGKIWGSSSKRGFIKGKRKATCFMDVPFASLKYVLTPENADPQTPRYEPYGVALTKEFAYREGCRPVLYLSNDEIANLDIPQDQLWRVVRFELKEKQWISWVHEREWRCPGSFRLPSTIQAAFVRTTEEASLLSERILRKPRDFNCRPRAIIPLTVLCQGLLS